MKPFFFGSKKNWPGIDKDTRPDSLLLLRYFAT
jgi:hypothetical protein